MIFRVPRRVCRSTDRAVVPAQPLVFEGDIRMQNATIAFALLAVICGPAAPAPADEPVNSSRRSGVTSAQYQRSGDVQRRGDIQRLSGRETPPSLYRDDGYGGPPEPNRFQGDAPTIWANNVEPVPAGGSSGPSAEEQAGQFPPGGPISEGTWSEPTWMGPPENRMYFQLGAMWLTRTDIAEQTVVQQIVGNVPVLTTNNTNLSDSAKPGLELTIGQRIDAVSAFELSYFGLNHWGAFASVTDPGNLTLPGNVGLTTNDFIFANAMTTDYSARLNNAEANYTQTLMGTTFLTGFRYFNLEENFTINSFGSSVDPSEYKVITRNNLVGGQLGAGLHQEYGRFDIDLTGKAGGYVNLSRQQTYLGDFGNTVTLRDFSERGSQISFLGELSIIGAYRITDWLSVRGGYRGMWVTGLALAPNQLDFSSSALAGSDLRSSSSLFFHGGFAGLEARW